MAGNPSHSLVVCVLGLSREKREHFSRQSGVGKSCLCYRFMHPGHDDYIDKHSSLLTLHEFENPVINSVHFLYWGSTTKRYPLRCSSKEQKIEFHVIEQTVFYHDVTSRPFRTFTKPDSLEYYIRRATAQIESTGKISYKSRETITLRQGQTYPSGISGLPRGFLVVIDVSQVGADFKRQIARAERIMEYLQKHKKKFVIVATKRDCVIVPASMSKVQHLERKYETQVFETSASVNLNISDAFRFIALKVLRKEVSSDYIPTYEEAAQRLLDQKASSRKIFRNYLKKTVLNSDERVNALENAEEYKDYIIVVGKFEADLLFAYHLFKVHSKKIGTFAVVKENPQLLLEFLEDFVDQRMDLALYSQRLRRWIRSYFGEHPVVSSEKEGSLGVKRREVASVSPTTKDINQRYQALHSPSNSDSDDSEDSNSYVNYSIPWSPTEKPGTFADYERGQLGSEKQEPDGMLQDFTSPTTRSKPPQVGPEPTLLSADEPEVQISVREKVGDMDKEEGSSNREVFANKLSAHLGSEVLSLTKETPSSSLKKCCHVKYSFSESAEHLGKLLSGKEELELEPTVAVASLNKSSHPVISLTKEASLHSLKKHSHVDVGSIPPFAQLVKQDSGNVGKNEKSMTSPGISDIKRRAEHLQKLLSGDGEPTVTDASLNMSSPPMTSFTKEEESELEPTVAVASLNKSSHPAISLTKEANLHSLKKHSHVDTGFTPPFAQLVKQDSGNVEKSITSPGISDIKRRAEHLQKLLSGDGEPTVTDASLNMSSPPMTSFTKEEELELEATVAVASLNKSSHPAISLTKEHSHVDTGFIPPFAQLVKQDSGNVGKNEKSMTSPGISDIKRRAEHLQKLLSGDGEPTVADTSLNMSSPPMTKEEKLELQPTVAVASLNKSSHPAISLTKEANLHSLKKHSHVDTGFTPPFAQLVKQDSGNVEKSITSPGISDIKRRAEHLQKLLSGDGEPTVTDASLNMSSPPMTSFTKEEELELEATVAVASLNKSSHPAISLTKEHSHVDTSFIPPFAQLVKQDSGNVGKNEKSMTSPGISDIKRRAEHLQKLLSGDGEPTVTDTSLNMSSPPMTKEEKLELQPTVAVASLNKSSHPAISLTKEANLHSLKKHSHVDTGFTPPFAQLVKQDSGNVEKSITSPGINDIKRRAEHLKKLLSGEGEPTVTDASLNMSSPPMTSFTKEVPLPSLKKSHFDNTSFKPSFVQLVKQTSGSVGEEASGSSDTKRCAECPEKLLEEELEPSIAEVPLNKSSPPQRMHGKRKQQPETSQPGTRKPAPKIPASPKSVENDSLKDRPAKPSSPSKLQGEQNSKSLFSLLSQLPPSRLQLSPITVPPPTRQTLQQSPVTPVSGSIPEKEKYVPRLPLIKRKLKGKLKGKKHLEEQQKVKDESFVAESPQIPGTSLSPNNSCPPQPSPKQMESAKPFPAPLPPLYQMVLPPSLPQTQMDPSLLPSPSKRMEFGRSSPNLTVSQEQTFRFPSSYSLGEDSQPPITSDVFLTQTTLGDGRNSEQHSICPQVTRMKVEQRVQKKKWFYPDIMPLTMKKQSMSESKKESLPTTSEVKIRLDEGRPHSTMTTTMLKPSDSETMKKRPLPAEPFTVVSEDDESDHTYEPIELGTLLTEYDNPSTFTMHHKCAPLLPAEVPVGFRVDSACKEEKQIMSPSSSDIKRQAEQPKKLLLGEEEFKPSAAVTLLKNSSPVATQYNKQRQSFQPGTRKPVRPASSKPPVSQKSAKDDSLEKTPLKILPPSRFQGEKVHKAQQPQLSPSQLQLSPITSPPPTYQVPKQSPMTRANGDILGTEMCISRFPKVKRNTEENCHEQPKETNQPPTVPTKKNRRRFPFDDPTVYENFPAADEPIEGIPAVDGSYENWETLGSIDSQFSAGGSPWPVQPPPVPAMRKSHIVNLPVPDKTLDYLPMSRTVDDMYVNWETIGSTGSQFSAGGSPRPVQHPPVPKPHRLSFVNLPVPDRTLGYHPMSRTVDDMYVNWETISSIPAQLRAEETAQPSQHPSIPTNSKPHTFSSDDLTDYVNLPVPDKLLVLPPSGLERQQQLMLESVQESSLRPIPSSRMPQSTGQKAHSPVSSNKPTTLPRMRVQKTSVLKVDPLITPYTSCTPEELLGPKAAPTFRPNPSPHHGDTGLMNHPDRTDISTSLPQQSILCPVGHFHSQHQAEIESAFSYDDIVTAQEVRSVGITTGGPTHCTSSWQRTNKVLHEKQQSLKQ